jgi:DNA-binding beta-propeller fold protein YncE
MAGGGIPAQPLSQMRQAWLQACCAVAGGAAVLPPQSDCNSSPRCLPDVCVGAVLADFLQRACVLGGRDGMPRSMGSVIGGAVALFLGVGLRGNESRIVATRGVRSWSNGVAVSGDGSTLLVTNSDGDTLAAYQLNMAGTSRRRCRRVVGGTRGTRLGFRRPCQVYIAPDDGFVFVADAGNHRVRVLTPTLDFHSTVGAGLLHNPTGVCASADIVAVSENDACRISVFSRGADGVSDSALLRRFGCSGSGDGQLKNPHGMCFVGASRDLATRGVAVADTDNSRVSVFSVDGAFVRHVGVGVLSRPHGVACSSFNELVVADTGSGRVVVFSGGGDVVATAGHSDFRGVAVCGGTVFAQSFTGERCVLFT